MYTCTLSLTPALDGGEWSTRRPKVPWVGPRAGLDGCGKSRPTRIRSPECVARTKSLYRLSHSGPRQRVLKHYQNKRLDNLEMILKVVSKNSECRQRVSCRGWRVRHTEVRIDQFYLVLTGKVTCWERSSMWTTYKGPLFATLKAAFIHCHLAETGFPALKIIYVPDIIRHLPVNCVRS